MNLNDLDRLVSDELPMHGLRLHRWINHPDMFEATVCRSGVFEPLHHQLRFTYQELEDCPTLAAVVELLRGKLRELRELRRKLGAESTYS